MNITRDNYEEYFLLFADNELTDQEKILVLKFVRDNEDLAEEFKMILATIVKAEDAPNFEKSGLYRSSGEEIVNRQNYHQYFIRYHDKELNEQEAEATRKFAENDPKLKVEFELFAKARLQADLTIVYPAKKELYKREQGKVISIVFWRTIAAAIFIGFGLWFFWDNSETNSINPVAINVDKPSSPNGKTQGNQIKADSNKLTNQLAGKEKMTEQLAKDPVDQVPERRRPVESKNVGENKNSQSRRLQVAAVKTQEKAIDAGNLPVNMKDEDTVSGDYQIAVVEGTPDAPGFSQQAIPSDENQVSLAQVAKTAIDLESAETQLMAKQAVMLTSDKDNDDNYVFYNVTVDEFRKSKVGSFLKKVKRVVVRTSPIGRLLSDNDDQIASTKF